MSTLHAHIKAPMDGPRNRNIFGAFALMVSDDIVRATSSRAPEAGPTASALALLAHEPGLSIRTLAIGVGLSRAGTVRLVDRLAAEGLIERRGHATDGRARSLYLTAAGRRASTKVLNARDQIIAEGLSVLSNEELVILGVLSERVLRARLQSLEHAYRVCRLCCHDACDDCPIDAELRQRALEDA
jgi:DNA-binding MarR family transcriptional regulator